MRSQSYLTHLPLKVIVEKLSGHYLVKKNKTWPKCYSFRSWSMHRGQSCENLVKTFYCPLMASTFRFLSPSLFFYFLLVFFLLLGIYKVSCRWEKICDKLKEGNIVFLW